MQIAVFGASGFIGSAIVADLLTHGHTVRTFCRQPARTRQRFPHAEAQSLHLTTTSADTLARNLSGCDAIINCIGILRAAKGSTETDTHVHGMKTLITAAEQAGIKRIVHISAVGIDTAQTAYASSKRQGDEFLQEHTRTTQMEAVILRPSLVYGQGSYGGSSALRGLAALPIMPLPSGGQQKFQPVCLPDLATIARKALTTPLDNRFASLDICGPDTLTTHAIANRLRTWLGRPPARALPLPKSLTRLLAKIGDIIPIGGLNTAIHEQLDTDYITRKTHHTTVLDVPLHSMDAFLQAHPSSVQDRWHARLHTLRPLANATIVALWAGSALAGLGAGKEATAVLKPLNIPPRAAKGLGYAFSLADLWLAWRTARGRPAWRVQIALVASYTLGLTVLRTRLWRDPYGALLKNLPILGLMIFLSQTEDDR